jgi:hypothetical protein
MIPKHLISNRCPICKTPKFGSSSHRCPPVFYVLLRFKGENEFLNEPGKVYALNPEEALERFVKQFDNDTDYQIASDNEFLDGFVFTERTYNEAQETEEEINWLQVPHEFFEVEGCMVSDYVITQKQVSNAQP